MRLIPTHSNTHADEDRTGLTLPPHFISGFHPWSSHTISLKNPPPSAHDHYTSLFLTPDSPPDHIALLDALLPYLPPPTALAPLLAALRDRLLSHGPKAQLGEVGLDKRARVPFPEAFKSSPEAKGRYFTPWSTPMTHQIVVLESQIRLARDVAKESGQRRKVSMHAVGVTGQVTGYLEGWAREELLADLEVCLHSCGISIEAWKYISSVSDRIFPRLEGPSSLIYLPPQKLPNVWISISPLVLKNGVPRLFLECDPTQILLESDQSDIRKSEEGLWEVVLALGAGRGWSIESEWSATNGEGGGEGVVARLERNWKRWIEA